MLLWLTVCLGLLLQAYGQYDLCYMYGSSCGSSSHHSCVSYWSSWTRCSHSCGGGTRTRTESCSSTVDKQECNKRCDNGGRYRGHGCSCPAWRTGRCCESCRHIHIAHCKAGQQQCGGNPDNIRCTVCEDPYYSAGYSNGCTECHTIANCEHRHCTSPSNVICKHCFDDNVYFLRTHADKQCERLCAWNNHYCWPGKCPDKLTSSCRCASGFHAVQNSSETSCQLIQTNAPSFETCETRVIGPNKEMKRADSTSTSTDCTDLTDFYGNFQPHYVIFDLLANFKIDIGTAVKPAFIAESKFGITDTSVDVKLQTIAGLETVVAQHTVLMDSNHSTLANETVAEKANLSLSINAQRLVDGDWLCVYFEANGGGYLKSYDLRQKNHIPSPSVPYTKTYTTRKLCYRFDTAKPEHCGYTNHCRIEPLQLVEKVTRSSSMSVGVRGWYDPIPAGGNHNHSSGIQSYEITLYEVYVSKDSLKVNPTAIQTEVIHSSNDTVYMNVSSNVPKMYAIYFAVKDVADNVRTGRRFVLYDNTSKIKVNPNGTFFVESASLKAKFEWQTHHDRTCLSWVNYFYNIFYFIHPLLNKIEPDPSGLISGYYEQKTGVLPSSGTSNVYGIIGYKISWTLNNGMFSAEKNVPDFQQQRFCQQFALKDGDTYTFRVKAIDIATNTLTDNRTVHVDRSAPHINNIWLEKDGFKTLFVHSGTDLSKMRLTFEALDPHSGIKEIRWAFATSDSGSDLTTGTLRIGSINGTVCPPYSTGDRMCYCPKVGNCEFYQYTIPLNDLVANNRQHGDHNRNYFFTIKVTNNAHLSNIEHLDILLDDSPPESGVVLEGSINSKDIDYTSDDSFNIHWHGFIDHESGIKLYKIALARHCVTSIEINNSNATKDLPAYAEVPHTESSTKVRANFTGKMFTTIIAMNNAMESSAPVCSDGITRDISAPQVQNISIQNAKWAESIVCDDKHTWFLNSNMQKVRLRETQTCLNACKNIPTNDTLINILPITAITKINNMVSDFLCQTQPVFDRDTAMIYLPNDHISVSWDVKEGGSQVFDYYVGFGLQRSEKNNPSQLKYTSTNRKMFFSKHHVGIGSSDPFYVFLKAENKAGLINIYPIGPLVIDETPPVSASKPYVQVVGRDVVITWENETFYDLDQRDQINQIVVQFLHDGRPVSPLMEWHLKTSFDCSRTNGGCFKYPLNRLQLQDTDFGLDFYASLTGYNNAGHFIQVDTATFQLPSQFPPGSAVVIDIDPKDMHGKSDVDVHFSASTLCAKWNGFRHHENITLEFAVGTTSLTDDVIPFKQIDNTPFKCLSSPNLVPGSRFHVLIRSNCSGGQTISSSNGVTIITQDFVNFNLKVNVGEECDMSTNAIRFLQSTQSGNIVFKPAVPVEIGQNYHIYGSNITNGSMEARDGILQQTKDHGVFSFVSFTEQPRFVILNTSIAPQHMLIVRCQNERFISSNDRIVKSYWKFATGNKYSVDFQAGLQEQSKTMNLPMTYISSTKHMSTVLNVTLIKPGLLYNIAVRVCTQNRCLDPILSENISFMLDTPTGDIRLADMRSETEKDCFDVSIQWNAFKSESPILFYQWSLSEEINANSPVTPWKTVRSNMLLNFEVNKCLYLPSDLQKQTYACLRTYAEGGQSVTTCRQLDVTFTQAYNTDVVYDIDTNNKDWVKIKATISSSNIGGLYGILHDSEIDFTTPPSVVAGVVLYGTERTIIWFLMTKRSIPNTCEAKRGCIMSGVTDTGYNKFATAGLKSDKVYYICARSNETHVEREMFTETLKELKSCSDGFIIDDSPPYGGRIHVMQNNGYLNELSHIRISWSGFYDNINASQLGYIDNIRSYSYSIGSRPGGENLIAYSDVGLSTVKVVNLSTVSDGSTVFISVKAVNRAGLSHIVTTNGLIIDTSAPQTGYILINEKQDKVYYDTNELGLRFVGFLDSESGIERYNIQIGSKPNTDNVHSSNVVGNNRVTIVLQESQLHDGYSYYINVKAFNRAGLSSIDAVKSFKLDRSAPTGGHVIEGDRTSQQDIDYQKDIHHIKSYWKGFDDIHSGIQSFHVGLGSKPFEDNVKHLIDVELSSDITWNGSFVPGQNYYTVVEACNKAGLCTKRSSDGIILDNSVPIHGIVRVGSRHKHQSYIPKSSSIHIHWNGFEDPQSDIDHFSTCVGSTPGHCDIVPLFNCLLQSTILKTGLYLPKTKYLFATVMAFNKVGMFVNRSSDAFRVDDTPPKLQSLPKFGIDNIVHGHLVKWEPSIVKISWTFSDTESPIINHFVTLKTHHDGHTPIENLQLGSENNITIVLGERSWLNNGDKYYAVVTSCNSAGHCTTAESQDLLIDYSAPHVGGFMPPLTWKSFNYTGANSTSDVSLTWYGFHDQESSIEQYFITVSRFYSGSELSNGTVEVAANMSSSEHVSTIELYDELQTNDKLILSIWARNKAGLNSSIARVSVNVLFSTSTSFGTSGVLELEKHSCDIHYCNQDCTCAIIGKPCISYNLPTKCKMLNLTDIHDLSLPKLSVFPGLRGRDTYKQTVTASSACISGYWKISDNEEKVKRYEWSIGLTNQPIGEGIFDLKNEIPWIDVGLHKEFIHCLSNNRSLTHGEMYTIYVRAWYGHDLSFTFTSNPIIVDHTPPTVRRGKYIKDSDASCALDFDYIDWMNTITACWESVFSDTQSAITHYMFALGTSPKADDIYIRTTAGLATTLTLKNLTLSHGTKYYFSITAYNSIGLHTSVSSDGFVIDMDRPVAGVVFNTGHHRNAVFQSLMNSLTISWHGFIDHFSGIHSYFVAIIEEQEPDLEVTNATFRNAGLQTKYTFHDMKLYTGVKLKGLVKAVDAAGHESDVSCSSTVTVDTTTPQGYGCTVYDDFIQESTGCSPNNDYNISTYSDLNATVFYHLNGLTDAFDIDSTVAFKVGRFEVALPMHFHHNGSGQFEYTFLAQDSGRIALELTGTCLPNTRIAFTLTKCTQLVLSSALAVDVQQFGLSTLRLTTMILDNDSGIKKILIGLGTTPGGFQIKALTPVNQGSTNVIHADVPHGAHLYASALAINHAGLQSVFHSKPVLIDKTPPVITQVPVIALEELTNTTQAINISWKIVDHESGIKQCFSKIDIENSFEVTTTLFVPTENIDYQTIDNVTLDHGDVIIARVRCINWLDDVSEASSNPVYISKEPPSAVKASVEIIQTEEETLNIWNIKPMNTQTQKNLAVQSNNSCVQLQWSGFTDITGIDHFEYRLKHDRLSITKWVSSGKQTMSTIKGIHLTSGSIYTAEVRAVNKGMYVTESVKRNVLVLGSIPQLTGLPIHISKVGNVLNLDWSHTFELNKHVLYTFNLIIGSKRGYSDIINGVYMLETATSVTVPRSNQMSATINEIFITVGCTCVTGLANTYVTTYNMF